jgi:peptide methionine sulfoxide reductase MsrA
MSKQLLVFCCAAFVSAQQPDGVGVKVYWGSGCFWGRQYEFVTQLEQGFFGRSDAQITAVGGYAGGRAGLGPDGLCCYHNAANASDYAALGHAEVVQVELPISSLDAAARAAAAVFFSSFVELEPGVWGREDLFDQGAGYRAVVGLPGGMRSPLMAALRAANVHNMTFVPGAGTDADTFGLNKVWVVDSEVLPFNQAELCLQFHNNQTGVYPPAYHALSAVLEADGRLHNNSCPPNYVC